MKATAKWHDGRESREMARANGWVMVRRPGCIPYTMFAREWDSLLSAEEGRKYAAEFPAGRAALEEKRG
jgi:hypothetical protein